MRRSRPLARTNLSREAGRAGALALHSRQEPRVNASVSKPRISRTDAAAKPWQAPCWWPLAAVATGSPQNQATEASGSIAFPQDPSTIPQRLWAPAVRRRTQPCHPSHPHRPCFQLRALLQVPELTTPTRDHHHTLYGFSITFATQLVGIWLLKRGALGQTLEWTEHRMEGRVAAHLSTLPGTQGTWGLEDRARAKHLKHPWVGLPSRALQLRPVALRNTPRVLSQEQEDRAGQGGQQSHCLLKWLTATWWQHPFILSKVVQAHLPFRGPGLSGE